MLGNNPVRYGKNGARTQAQKPTYMRCPKCGSDKGFIFENGFEKREVERVVDGAIKASFIIFCKSCSHDWPFEPPQPKAEKKPLRDPFK